MKPTITLALAIGLLTGNFLPAVALAADRALIAIAKDEKFVYLGWRLLGTDPTNIAFNVYRTTDGGAAVKLNPSPIQASSFSGC
ncbi:MAG TPA: hypothetical protein PKG82_01720 [Myxococcota bacterium]|nr:hypothetical protein [Myxococcota bacterium]